MFSCPHLFQPLNPEAPRTGGPGYCSGRTWSILISSGSTHLRTAVGSLGSSQRSSYTSGTSGSPGGPQGRECQNEEGRASPAGLGLSPSSSKPFCL